MTRDVRFLFPLSFYAVSHTRQSKPSSHPPPVRSMHIVLSKHTFCSIHKALHCSRIRTRSRSTDPQESCLQDCCCVGACPKMESWTLNFPVLLEWHLSSCCCYNPISLGIIPERALKEKSMLCKKIKDPTSVGMVPDNRFEER